MKEYRELKLLDGVFIPELAQTVILKLIESKIHYHKTNQLSGDLLETEKRLTELFELHELIKKIVQKAINDHKKLKVYGSIEIQLID